MLEEKNDNLPMAEGSLVNNSTESAASETPVLENTAVPETENPNRN